MIPDQIVFRVEQRDNTFRETGTEWVLKAQMVGHQPWVLKTWEKPPSDAIIKEHKTIIMRSFEFYHRHLKIPPFDLSEVTL